jgi:hypothetical protein
MASFNVKVEIFEEFIAYIIVKIFKIIDNFLQYISLPLINNRLQM